MTRRLLQLVAHISRLVRVAPGTLLTSISNVRSRKSERENGGHFSCYKQPSGCDIVAMLAWAHSLTDGFEGSYFGSPGTGQRWCDSSHGTPSRSVPVSPAGGVRVLSFLRGGLVSSHARRACRGCILFITAPGPERLLWSVCDILSYKSE